MSEKKKKVTTTVTTVTTTEEIIDNKIVETHYFLILDKSGSMSSVRDVTISGFNEQIQTIQSLEKKYPNQKYFVSLLTFNDEIQENYIDRPASEIPEITVKDYQPKNGTALLDAMGFGISKLEDKLSPDMNDSNKIVTAVIIVMTDGQENSSKTWSIPKVKELVDRLSKNDKWTISFIGANQDAVLMGSSLGVNLSNSMNYSDSVRGTRSVGTALTNVLYSRAKQIDDNALSFMGGSIKANDDYFSSVVKPGSNTISEDLVDNSKEPKNS